MLADDGKGGLNRRELAWRGHRATTGPDAALRGDQAMPPGFHRRDMLHAALGLAVLIQGDQFRAIDTEFLATPALIGMEATGNCHWQVDLLAEIGHELWVGDPAEIRARRVRRQKTDRCDAEHLLELLLTNRFPRVWVPTPEERDARQPVAHFEVDPRAAFALEVDEVDQGGRGARCGAESDATRHRITPHQAAAHQLVPGSLTISELG